MQVWWDRGIPLFLHTLCTYSQLLQRERLINGHNGVHYWQSNSLYFITQYKEPSFSFKTVTVWVFCFQGLEQYKVSSLLGYSGEPGVPSASDWLHSDQFFCNPTFFPFTHNPQNTSLCCSQFSCTFLPHSKGTSCHLSLFRTSVQCSAPKGIYPLNLRQHFSRWQRIT